MGGGGCGVIWTPLNSSWALRPEPTPTESSRCLLGQGGSGTPCPPQGTLSPGTPPCPPPQGTQVSRRDPGIQGDVMVVDAAQLLVGRGRGSLWSLMDNHADGGHIKGGAGIWGAQGGFQVPWSPQGGDSGEAMGTGRWQRWPRRLRPGALVSQMSGRKVQRWGGAGGRGWGQGHLLLDMRKTLLGLMARRQGTASKRAPRSVRLDLVGGDGGGSSDRDVPKSLPQPR